MFIVAARAGAKTAKAVQGAIEEKASRKNFNQLIVQQFDIQCQAGRLQPLPNGGWVMTDAGANAILTVYEDINRALAYFHVTGPQYQEMGLTARLEITATPQTPGSCRDRIGERWDRSFSETLLASTYTNPFRGQRTMKKMSMTRFAEGILLKSMKSRQFSDLFLVRILGLAQLCGIGRIALTDLEELIVNSHMYEKLARAHIAAVIGGGVDASFITNMAHGNIFDGQPLGSTALIDAQFDTRAALMYGERVQIGTMDPSIKSRFPKKAGENGASVSPSGGMIHLTYPRPLDQLSKINIYPRSKIQAQHGEPVYMQKGWTTAMCIRPPQQRPLPQTDIHGNQMQFKKNTAVLSLSIKRVAEGQLMAKVTTYKYMRLGACVGQGVFGKPCACTAPNPACVIQSTGGPRSVNGVRLLEHRDFDLARQEFRFHDLYVDWAAGDLPAQIYGAEWQLHSTYVQVRGECLYCAIDRALGTGCAFLVAGAF